MDQRRDQLLALGVELFSRRPVDSVSIDEIAEAAGISRGLLYHYFGSKRAFFVEVVRAAVDELLALIETDLTVPPAERLERSIRAYLDYVVRRRHGYLMATQGEGGSESEVRAIVEAMRARVVELVLEGMGEPHPSDRLRASVRGWVGYLEGLVLAWLGGADIDEDDIVELAITTLAANADPDGEILGGAA